MRDAQPGELVAKRVGRILRPPVAPQRQVAGDVLAEGSVGVPHALVYGLGGKRTGEEEVKRDPKENELRALIVRSFADAKGKGKAD